MNKRVIFLSDFNMKGSGYLSISLPMCKGLAESGYEIMAIGLGYMGEEHDLPFSIVPCPGLGDAQAMLNNLAIQWGAGTAIIALDIPMVLRYAPVAKQLGLKVMAITPLENPPLTLSWAMGLQELDKVFFISQLGADEANKAGVMAEHLICGMDTKSWRMRTKEEYEAARKTLNISPETLVVITVADNQERKNLSKAMEIVSKVKHDHGQKVKYILVTREHSEVGWKLRDLAMQYKIAPDVMIFERGMPFKELFMLYAMADAFLLTSKAEGLCYPVMEAMSVGVPVVTTNCGAMTELLYDGRGYLMETEYSHIDPWGNSRRDFPKAESGSEFLSNKLKLHMEMGLQFVAREYMESRTWDIPVKQVVDSLEKLHEQK